MDYKFVSDCGYECQLVKNVYGIYCGYVQLPKHHPYYNKNYDDILDLDLNFNLTYGKNGKFGFDCWSNLKSSELIELFKTKNYNGKWNFKKVKRETENMARQFKLLEN
ncbi:hypothetical protein Catovirus_1_1023 [Catovirus CTV1]|uniref:Uncharacterized protein n=1 Tax=Catovirus CTV1 TaxID=1977631 RepID=A0A1V0SB85_9VIRU|nr:hypothetical protein Catovirus_1_1023 [Catovirus CTV1]